MRTARLALALLLAFGFSQAAKLPGQNHGGHNHGGHNNQGGAQSSANSGAGGNYWWQNNDAFGGGGGGGNRPAAHASGNANVHASAGTSGSASSSGSANSGGGSYGGGSYGGGGGGGGGGSQQSGNLQNAVANPPQITVSQPQQGFNPNVFTPDQSPHCARGQDCVRWQLCQQGVITLTGKSIPKQKPVPNGMSAQSCGMLGNVCCAIPANILATQQQLGHTNFQQPQQSLQQPQQSQQLQNYPSSSSQNQQSIPSNQNQQNFPSNQNQQNFPRPSQQPFQNQANFPQAINNNNIQQQVPAGPPYPECSASLFCVRQNECNLYNGRIEPQIEQFPGQQFVQISMCTSDTLPEGVCCQEPHPEFDPWTERPGLDQQQSGSQQQNSQQQFVGQKPQGQQFGTSGQHSRPQGNQVNTVSASRPQTNFQSPNVNTFQQQPNQPQGNQGNTVSVNQPQTSFQPPNSNTFQQQPNRPAIQQPTQAITFPHQNQPRPGGYQQSQTNQNNSPQQPQPFQQPQQPNRPVNPSNNNNNNNGINNFQTQQQTNQQFQQPNRPVNPSHNNNGMPNLNIIGLPNQQSSTLVGPNEQFPTTDPHPTCSSGLFCVQRSECNLYNGFIEEQVQTHKDQQFIAINLCTIPGVNDGVCCQRKLAPGAQIDEGQYRGPGATNSGHQQTFVQQGSRPQQSFNQPQQTFVSQNQQPQHTGGNQNGGVQHTVGNNHGGVQPGQQQGQQQQQGGFDWQNSDAFQQQVPSYGG